MELFKIVLATLLILIGRLGFTQCSDKQPHEAVRNGNFEAGYLSGPAGTTHTYTAGGLFDFQSDMDYIGPAPTGYPSMTCDPRHNNIGDKYMVAKRETFSCGGYSFVNKPLWGAQYLSSTIPLNAGVDVQFQDHTSGLGGNGYALLVDLNTYTAKNSGKPIAWSQTVNIIPNQTYYFSAYLAKMWYYGTTGVGDMQVRIIPYRADNTQGTVSLQVLPTSMTGAFNWQQLSYAWTPDNINYTRVKIQLEYNETIGGNEGLDIVIDDISFINSCQNIAGTQPGTMPNLGSAINLCTGALPKTLNSNVATSGAPLRQFSWYSGTGITQTTLVSASAAQNTYNISAPGTYRVCMFETGKCAVSSTVIVSESVSATGSDINYCLNDQLVASVSPTDADPFMAYSWTKNASSFPGSSKTITANGIGTYIITGTHSSGRAACNLSKTFNVTASTASLSSSIGPGPYSLCTPSSQILTSSLTGTGYAYRWQKNGIDLGGTASSYTATSAGTYHVVIDIGRVGCSNVTSNDVTITNTNAITPVDVAFCPNAKVTLSVTPALANVYKWYQSDGVTPVPGPPTPNATSSSYTTSAPLSASTTFYVEDVGSTPATLSTIAGANNGWGVLPEVTFNLTNPIVLKSVEVVRGGTYQGPLNAQVEIVDASNARVGVPSNNISVGDGIVVSPSIFSFNGATGISIPAGNGYKMRLASGASTGAIQSFSNPSGSGLTVMGVSSGNNIFGNWSIDVPSNPCTKVPVRALADCSLPVDFINFIATVSSAGNHLQWLVSNEKNVNNYEIEKSIDGIHFVTIGTVDATKGSGVKTYSFLDNRVEASTEYFRIKEVDINGTPTYSSIQAISSSESNFLIVSKNPFEENTQVYFISSGEEVNHLRITDSKGALLAEYTVKGAEVITLGQGWTSGLYLVQAWNNHTSKTYKVIKK